MNKWMVGLAVLGALLMAWALGLQDLMTLSNVKTQQAVLSDWVDNEPVLSAIAFSLAYVLMTTFSVPGAALMTLLAGALFGWVVGVVLVLLSASIGALLAMLMARYVLRDWVAGRYRKAMASVNAQIEKQGAFYLFTLRLVPLFPFFLVNLLMGLTTMVWSRYFWVSALGMAPGTMVYVNAGAELSAIDSLDGVLAPNVLLAFVLLAALPWLAKSGLARWSRFKRYRGFKRPKQYDYDLIVIGAGSGGLVAALIASTLKARVALVESGDMGGDCLNTGCVPSKALLARAGVAQKARDASGFGVSTGPVSVDFEAVMSQVEAAIATIAPNDSVERYTALGVDVIKGWAQLTSPFEVQVNEQSFSSRSIIMASGASPIVPDMASAITVPVLTSDTVWSLQALPQRLLVVGGGAIGCEMAQAFQRLGSQVVLVEAMSRLVAREEPEVSDRLEASLAKEGIEIYCNARFNGQRPTGQMEILTSGDESDGHLVEVDAVLFALGRTPTLDAKTQETLRFSLGRGGSLQVNESLQTDYPNIYGVGDVTGQIQLTHAASHMAWTAAVNALFGDVYALKVDFSVMPSCIYTSPEVARVGATRESLAEEGRAFEVTRFELSDLDRAIAENNTRGFVQVLTEPGSDRLLGATIVAPHAGEMLSEFVLAMRWGLGLNKILSTVHAYPTWSEANKRVAGVWRQKSKPEWALDILKRYFAWRRGKAQ